MSNHPEKKRENTNSINILTVWNGRPVRTALFREKTLRKVDQYRFKVTFQRLHKNTPKILDHVVKGYGR